MKLRSFLLTALAASTTLAACDKSENPGPNPDNMPKSVTITLPNINKPVGRATGDVMSANQIPLKNLKVFFLDAEGNEQTVPQFENRDQTVYFETIPDAPVTYHFLPAATAKVVVIGNVENQNVTYAAANTTYNVLNDGDAGVGTDGHPYYPLYGDSLLTPKNDTDDKEHANVYTATVTLAPRIARFEIYGFEYKKDQTKDWSYDHLELTKIALSNYYPQYNLENAAPQGTKVVCPTEPAEIWDWIDTTAAEPWANKFTSFTLNHDDKVFVTNNTKGEAIPADNDKGAGATKVVTFGLTKAADSANNPELLLSFYGVDADSNKTPLYLRGKFTSQAAFEPGKIYRVLFSITDDSWTQPERCVELTVSVAPWDIVAVTPEF